MIISERLRIAAKIIEAGEGGLSRAKTDTASANPAPWTYKGYSDWHTNRGVTYSAFKTYSGPGTYAHTPENFFNMPDSVWFTIFKKGYWDAINADNINSLPIAIYAVSWVWGSGKKGGTNLLVKMLKELGYNTTESTVTSDLNKAVSKYGEQPILNKMLDVRAAFFKSLNQPSNLNGWLNRLERYRKALTELIVKKKV